MSNQKNYIIKKYENKSELSYKTLVEMHQEFNGKIRNGLRKNELNWYMSRLTLHRVMSSLVKDRVFNLFFESKQNGPHESIRQDYLFGIPVFKPHDLPDDVILYGYDWFDYVNPELDL